DKLRASRTIEVFTSLEHRDMSMQRIARRPAVGRHSINGVAHRRGFERQICRSILEHDRPRFAALPLNLHAKFRQHEASLLVSERLSSGRRQNFQSKTGDALEVSRSL